jgi:hypothetical protein
MDTTIEVMRDPTLADAAADHEAEHPQIKRRSGGTPVVQFREGLPSGLLSRGLNRAGRKTADQARLDLLAYYQQLEERGELSA